MAATLPSSALQTQAQRDPALNRHLTITAINSNTDHAHGEEFKKITEAEIFLMGKKDGLQQSSLCWSLGAALGWVPAEAVEVL